MATANSPEGPLMEGATVAPRRRLGARVPGRVAVLAVAMLALLCVPLLYPVLVPYAYVLQLMTGGFMWIAFASSWNIIGGYTGYVSLGHNVFVAVGAYFSAALFVYAGISPFVTALGAGLVCAALGVVVGLITLRTRGDAFIIATIALMLIALIAFDNWMWLGGSSGLAVPVLRMSDAALVKVPFYYAMLVVAAAAVYLSYRIRHSRFGLGLRAIAQDEIKAEVAGVDTRAYKVAAFALSGVFIGVAGALWGYSLFYLRPEIFLAIGVAADMVLMAVIGGRGTVAGPVIGAVLIVAFNEWSVSQFGSSELNLTITGALLVLVLLFFPRGIIGSLRARRRLPRLLDWG
jgi:branched-chain amino acid transport system permease protein